MGFVTLGAYEFSLVSLEEPAERDLWGLEVAGMETIVSLFFVVEGTGPGVIV
jgi:hypothetical protein